MKKLLVLSLTILLSLPMVVEAASIESVQKETRKNTDKKESEKVKLTELGFLTGYGHGQLKEQGNYNIVPLFVRLGYDIKPWVKDKLQLNPRGRLTFEVEPFINPVTSPATNVEIGVGTLMKYNFRNPNRSKLGLMSKVDPYIEGGIGVIYSSQPFKYSTNFNFNDQVGIGLDYELNDDKNLVIGYRYRHVSNASLKQPNGGIDTHMIISGITWKR